jgi:TRAP-type C4-dicarboxylate transport system substrate-binding protein
MNRYARTVVIALAGAACVAGCGGGDKAGGSGGVVTLRIGTADVAGRPSGAAIEEFAEQARDLSDGRIRVEPVWRAGGRDATEWDQQVARMVASGELEMGLVPARAWDTEGVTSLRALHAPFLVTSDAHVERIVTSDLAGEMLAGLDRAGVVGLALLPEELRHPFGFARTFRSVDDFAGQTIRTPRSDVAYALLRRLGASPDDHPDSAFGPGVADGSIAGAESGFAIAAGTLPRLATATGNVTFYPKVNSLVVDQDAWSELTDDQRDTLREAAERTVPWVLEGRVPEAEAAQQFCRRGGRVVLAEESTVAEIVEAARPVYDELERDAQTKALIGRIRDLSVPAEAAAAACDPPAERDTAAAGAVDARLLDGVWRMDVSYQEGVDAGLPPAVAGEELGLQTIRMEGGRYDWRWRSRIGDRHCPGVYEVAGDRVTFTDTGECATSRWEATFELDGRTLRWSRPRSHAQGDPVDQTIREMLHVRPWRMIDEVRSAQPDFPEGVYRADIPRAFLIEQGIDPSTATTSSGISTMTFEGGRWLHHTESASNEPDCGGVYSADGGRVTITLDPDPECGSAAGGTLFSASWTLADGELRLTGVRSGDGDEDFADAMWGGKPWRKID